MKKILITGANSCIGTTFESYILKDYDFDYQINTIDMKGAAWNEHDFSIYDVIFHVAGIAHADVGNVSEETKQLYYKVNTKLTIDVAKKAKASKVGQFIFMSSIIVYGDSAPVGKKKQINKHTVPKPSNFYGDSKLQADIGLLELADDMFKVCIVRPPMIYGQGSKGNYQLLSNLARKLPIFPDIKNQRSMLYIGNLCRFIKDCVDCEYDGILFPQNNEYVSTALMVKAIAEANHRQIHLTKLLNPFVLFASKLPGKLGGLVNKAFGDLIYENLIYEENFISTLDSIEKTEQQE